MNRQVERGLFASVFSYLAISSRDVFRTISNPPGLSILRWAVRIVAELRRDNAFHLEFIFYINKFKPSTYF